MKLPHLAINNQLRLFQFGVAVCIILVLAIPASAQDEPKSGDTKEIESLECKVLVVDPDGNPIEDALVYCTGLHSPAIPSGTVFPNPDTHGPLPKLKTNENGIVEMPYPKYLGGELETGRITWTVEHPDFVQFSGARSVKDDPAEIMMNRGFRIAMTAVNGETGAKTKDDLYAVISGAWEDWDLRDNGTLVSPVFEPRDCTVRFVQLAENKPVLFSEAISVEPGDRSRVLLRDVKLFPGTRVEGRVDESVKRPIKNGRVSAMLVRQPLPKHWRNKWLWADEATIREDGSFVFESLPPDEILQIIAVCDGSISSRPDITTVLRHFPEEDKNFVGQRVYPQLVPLNEKTVEVILAMEKTASVQITVTTTTGELLPNATVSMVPNQYFFEAGSNILGSHNSQRDLLQKTRDGSFEFELKNPFTGITDENGIATIENLPAYKGLMLATSHDDFIMPAIEGEQILRIDLQPGKTAKISLQLEAKKESTAGDKADPKNNRGK